MINSDKKKQKKLDDKKKDEYDNIFSDKEEVYEIGTKKSASKSSRFTYEDGQYFLEVPNLNV